MIRFERDGDGYRITINIVALVKRAAWFGGSRLSRRGTIPVARWRVTTSACRWSWCSTIPAMPDQPGLAVRLEYCAQCGYLPRAQWMLGELLAALQDDVASFTLIPSGGGCFEWSVDGETVFSKRASGRFPEMDEIMELLADRL